MKLTLEIKCDNAAFAEPGGLHMEAIAILKRLIRKLEMEKTGGTIMDTNGNSVGTWGFYD